MNNNLKQTEVENGIGDCLLNAIVCHGIGLDKTLIVSVQKNKAI